MSRKVEFTIDEDGNIEVDMQGFHGKGCSQLSEKLARALGVVVKNKKKAEYYQSTKTKQKIRRGL